MNFVYFYMVLTSFTEELLVVVFVITIFAESIRTTLWVRKH